jgi:hypothetical protein
MPGYLAGLAASGSEGVAAAALTNAGASAQMETLGPDRFRTVSGRERGELLTVVRDAGGRVVKLYRATYPLTRELRAFGDSQA